METSPGIHVVALSAAILAASCGGSHSLQSSAPADTRPAQQSKIAEPDEQLKQLLESSSLPDVIAVSDTPDRQASALFDQVRRFYERTGYQMIWVDANRPSARYTQLVQALHAAPHHGLDPDNYDVRTAPGLPVRASMGSDVSIPADRAAEFDVWTTFSMFRYATDLKAGQVDPHTLETEWLVRAERPDLVESLAQAIDGGTLPGAMDDLAPQHPEYVALQHALDRYVAIQANGGWPEVPAVPKLKLKEGASSPIVPALRQRLSISGDLDAPGHLDASLEGDPTLVGDPSLVFDSTLAEAVRRFQQRHQLTADGIVTPAVVTAMNVTVDERIRQIELNMERWRWLPAQMPDRYLRVNIPEYRLDAIEAGNSVMDMRVVVGQPRLATPVFSEQMKYVVFSPYWNIPPSIVNNEINPHVAKDADYLTRQNIDVIEGANGSVSYRQRPGPHNSLGLIKFLFPNKFNVYMHDTPARSLFQKQVRDLSHGCVRLAEPMKLAQYVLRDQPDWTEEKIVGAMNSGTERHVNLKAPLPVFILYFTAAADDQGNVTFVPDIYGHDARQMTQFTH